MDDPLTTVDNTGFASRRRVLNIIKRKCPTIISIYRAAHQWFIRCVIEFVARRLVHWYKYNFRKQIFDHRAQHLQAPLVSNHCVTDETRRIHPEHIAEAYYDLDHEFMHQRSVFKTIENRGDFHS